MTPRRSMRAWGDLPATTERDGRDARPPSRRPASTSTRRRRAHHRHADEAHPSDHAHPHVHSGPGEPPIIGIVGAGAVGTALGVALTRAGWPVHAVASRDPGRRERFRSLVDVTRVFADPEPILDEVELIILAVPDDAVAPLAGSLRMYSGQAMIHTSGALGAEVLAPAMAAGTQIGAFHPLVAFADTERAVAALHGATVAIEGDDQLAALLADMAEAIGADAGPPGARARRRPTTPRRCWPPVAFVALLDAIAELGRVAGLDEAGSLAIYGPLIEGTLGNARALGIRAALTGPMTRGDVGTLEAHLDDAAAPTPHGVLDCTSPRRAARSIWPRRVAPWHRRRQRRCANCSPRPCKPGLNRYHSLPWITASRPSTRPARRPDSSAPRPASGSAGSASARPARSARRAFARRSLRGPEVAPLARLRASWRAIHPAVTSDHRSGRPRPLVAMEWARSGRPGAVRRPGAASAPWPA